MRAFFINVLLMVALVAGLYRLLVMEFPVLPWEKPDHPPVVASGTPGPSVREPLRIGVSDRPAYLPMASITAWLSPSDVRVVSVPDVSERWQMLADGRLDMACGTLDSFALARLHEDPGAWIFSIGSGAGEDVLVGQAGLEKVQDLVGKTVAVPRGGPGEYLLGLIFSQDGLALSQSSIVYTATCSEAAAMVQKKAAQGALLWDPSLNEVRSSVVTLASTADSKTPHAEEMCAASRAVLLSRRGEVLAVMRAYFRLVDKLKSTPGLAREAVSQETHVPAGQLADYLKTVQFSTLMDNRNMTAAGIESAISDAQSNLRMMGRKPTVNVSSPAVSLDLVNQVPSSGSDTP